MIGCRLALGLHNNMVRVLIISENDCLTLSNTYNMSFIFMNLAAKVEEVFDKPRVLVIHDIVTDQEVDKVVTQSSGRLRRATARNARTGQFEAADYRIRFDPWLAKNTIF